MPITPSWSYEPGLDYKPAGKLIHLLIDIVAKGGNFLLNVAPTFNGDFEEEAYGRLKEIGKWMKINGEAIYNSHPVKPYKEDKICFTQLKNGTTYAIYLLDENESSFPESLNLSKFCPMPNAEIELVGTNTKLTWQKKDDGCEIYFPQSIRGNPPNKYAWTLKFSIPGK